MIFRAERACCIAAASYREAAENAAAALLLFALDAATPERDEWTGRYGSLGLPTRRLA